MSDLPPYPPINPTTYDLILIGIGLHESIITAAASSAGKSVFHLNLNPFYGFHFSSLSPPNLSSFLHNTNNSNPHSTPPPSDFTAVNLATHSPYTYIQISNFSPEIQNQHSSTKFNVEIFGPRVLFCTNKVRSLTS